MPNLIAVGLAEIKWSASPGDVLTAFSLGSCVGVAIWDPERRAGAMAHVVLPQSPSGWTESMADFGKYADTAVRHLHNRFVRNGTGVAGMRVWIAGGAHVLRGVDLPGGDIGASNTKAVLEALRRLGFNEPRKSVGEDYGRTMRLYVGEGRATVYSVARGESEI